MSTMHGGDGLVRQELSSMSMWLSSKTSFSFLFTIYLPFSSYYFTYAFTFLLGLYVVLASYKRELEWLMSCMSHTL